MTQVPVDDIVNSVVKKMYEDYPELLDKYGEKGKRKAIEDNHHHMKHLETAYELENPVFFTDYASWLNGILEKFGMSADLLIYNFDEIDKILGDMNPDDRITAYRTYLDEGIKVLRKKA
ncbi:hypothetical protein LCY76_01310 [Fictibacillus sp. KIGAM418]|uniref:Uncharacterized protein n=1 Tax=Fictibacillus marinisediminis TaxID=2878389 RepID=A0A9X2BFB0_9BACL|nr:hypothetical protein [Fictibacillus marinisediminis]MCK6255283.1 hypothetical protein [Fictibacillus marinisediminis]